MFQLSKLSIPIITAYWSHIFWQNVCGAGHSFTPNCWKFTSCQNWWKYWQRCEVWVHLHDNWPLNWWKNTKFTPNSVKLSWFSESICTNIGSYCTYCPLYENVRNSRKNMFLFIIYFYDLKNVSNLETVHPNNNRTLITYFLTKCMWGWAFIHSKLLELHFMSKLMKILMETWSLGTFTS